MCVGSTPTWSNCIMRSGRTMRCSSRTVRRRRMATTRWSSRLLPMQRGQRMLPMQRGQRVLPMQRGQHRSSFRRDRMSMRAARAFRARRGRRGSAGTSAAERHVVRADKTLRTAARAAALAKGTTSRATRPRSNQCHNRRGSSLEPKGAQQCLSRRRSGTWLEEWRSPLSCRCLPQPQHRI